MDDVASLNAIKGPKTLSEESSLYIYYAADGVVINEATEYAASGNVVEVVGTI